MEIRPLNRLWEASPENWRLDCSPGRYRMQKGNDFLIDIRSQSWEMVSNLLRPFDTSQNLLVSASPSDPSQSLSSLQLTVALPRYDLSFYVDEDGDLQSHNMRGMVYDKNQSVGTLFGLANRLVLRPKVGDTNAPEIVPRCVLIPDGKVSYQKDGHHVHVEVNVCGSVLQRAVYQTYMVDTELGCLTGNVSLGNKLYCAYLHALTSGCGTDPLTGRSGTEEALSLLRSANCWSVMRLSSREAELLSSIASISPMRTWYPEHLRCMQQVDWLDLPVSSQHHELYIVTKGIKEHCERVLSFQESQPGDLFQSFPSQDEHLLKRSAIRTVDLFPSEFSCKPSGLDDEYFARDLVDGSSAEHRAYTAGTSVHRRTVDSMITKNILSMVESWTRSVSGDATLSLRYNRSWLAPNLPSIWLKAYTLLRRGDEGRWFRMLFSLSAMAYASSELAELVPVFVAFATDLQFQLEDPPHYDSYNISEGYQPSRATLCNYVSDCAYSFERSPECSEPANYNETLYDQRQRQLRMYNSRRNSDINATVNQLMNAWPCETPPQYSLRRDLYDVSTLRSNVQKQFSGSYRNLKLKEHLARVQNILSKAHSLASPTTSLQYSFQPSHRIPSSTSWSLSVDQLFTRPAPSLREHNRLPPFATNDKNTSLSGSVPLHQLIATVEANSVNPFQRHYVSALRASAECLGNEMSLLAHRATKQPTLETLVAHYTQCRADYIASLDEIKQHLGPKSQSEQALEQSGQWPRITAHALFRCLSTNSSVILSDKWKECLIRLTLLALEFQRARRLLLLYSRNLREELHTELQNEGCDGWNAEAHPDWLLVQVCLPCDSRVYQLTRPLSSTSVTRQLFSSSRSGCGRCRDDITTLRHQHGHATQHGRGKVIRDCSHRRRCPRRWFSARPRHCPESVDSTNVSPSCGSSWYICQQADIFPPIFSIPRARSSESEGPP